MQIDVFLWSPIVVYGLEISPVSVNWFLATWQFLYWLRNKNYKKDKTVTDR
jgi:hypothetical protein